MNTDRACEVLGLVANSSREQPISIAELTDFKEVSTFAILRMRELDSMKKALRGIVTEFVKEAP